MSPETFFVALEEAKRQGLPYAGHLSNGVDAVAASKAGMRAIEHLGPMDTLLISCSTAEPSIRQAQATRLPPSLAGSTPADLRRLRTMIANPNLLRAQLEPQFASRYTSLNKTFDEQKCKQVAQGFVQNNTWQVPTLIRERTMDRSNDPRYVNDPNLKYVSPATRQSWASLGDQFSSTFTPADQEAFKQYDQLLLKLTKLFDVGGVENACRR